MVARKNYAGQAPHNVFKSGGVQQPENLTIL